MVLSRSQAAAANIKTIQGLKQKLTLEWEKLPWSYIRTSVRSMKARLVECVELEGGRTHYEGQPQKILPLDS